MEAEIRAAGFAGPVAVIPHGAWIPEADRNAVPARLGLDETTPLVGIFGFLKPYKRIAESLRAFRRLVRLVPRGQDDPGGRAASRISARRGRSARWASPPTCAMLGFTPIEDFVGYLAACDIVLNLRYPTVGESSGHAAARAGTGQGGAGFRGRLVSGVPGRCVPEGAGGRGRGRPHLRVPEPAGVAAGGGAGAGRARAGVRGARVQLGRGGAAVRGVSGSGGGGHWRRRRATRRPKLAGGSRPGRRPRQPPAPERLPPPRSGRLCARLGDRPTKPREYFETHQTRLAKTLAIIPPGGPCDRVLEMGAYLQITPALRTKLGYGEVRGCYYGAAGPHRPSRGDLRRRRDFRVRHRPFRRREGPLPVSRRALLHGAVLRADRAPVRRSHAPDERGEPHSQARRPPGADHAQRGLAAGHLGDSARLSSGLLSRLHTAGRIGRGGRAAQPRVHAQARSTCCWKIRGSTWSCSRPASFATCRIPSAAGCGTCWSATGWRRICAATASTPWGGRPGR